MRSKNAVMPLTYLVAIVILGITVVPLLFVFVDGFRSTGQINASPAGLPDPWVWSNYSTILTSAPFWQFLGNSTLIAVVATVLAVVLGSMAGYALSRYEFRGREGIYTLFVSGLLFPLGVAALRCTCCCSGSACLTTSSASRSRKPRSSSPSRS